MKMTMIGTDPLLTTVAGSHFDSPEGGTLWARDEKSELFLAVVTTTDGSSFYEHPEDRNSRIRQLVSKIASQDPAWLLRLVRWARDEGNMRRVPQVVTTAMVHDRLDRRVADHQPGRQGLSRVAINVACLRADEPSRMLKYWADTYGTFPKPLKRGLGDACRRLYTERACLKYDTPALDYRFGDVLEICHPTPVDERQAQLFEWLLNRRHGRKVSTFTLLGMVAANEESRERQKEDLVSERARLIVNPDELKRAGMTWENLSGMGAMDAAAWEAMIPHMGYMALLKNLRNFDEAEISADAFARVFARLSDMDEVMRSRQFPFRFLSAYMNASERWQPALEQAVTVSCRNIPELPGRTLQLIDCSVSMWDQWGPSSTPSRAQKAGLFAAAMAKRSPCETWVFGDFGRQKKISTNRSALAVANGLTSLGGTDTASSLRAIWRAAGPFDRVIILTDEQIAHDGDPGQSIPQEVPLYTFNVAGYKGAQTKASPTRHTFGGLTDQGFSAIPAIEAAVGYTWPF